MRPAHHGRFRRQVEFLRQQFLQEGGLPFTDLLTEECISNVVEELQLYGIEPGTISFKGTLQLLNAFQPVIAGLAHAGVDPLELLYQQMLRAIAQHRVADRPDRFEPRMSKRKPKGYDRLTRPRKDIKREMMKGVRKP